MSKRLHIHSLPFIGLALALTGIAFGLVVGAHDNAAVLALLRPITHTQSQASGSNLVTEKPGIADDSLAGAAGLGNSVTLHQTLDQAFTKQ